jgi:hypothetical protein
MILARRVELKGSFNECTRRILTVSLVGNASSLRACCEFSGQLMPELQRQFVKNNQTSFGFAEYPLEFLQQTIRKVCSKTPAKSITSRQPNELRCSVVCTTAKSQVMRSNSFSIVQLFCQNICVMSVSQVKRSNFYQFLAIQPTVPDSNRHFFMGENAHSCILKLRVVDYMPGLVVSVHKSLRQAQRFP